MKCENVKTCSFDFADKNWACFPRDDDDDDDAMLHICFIYGSLYEYCITEMQTFYSS